MAKSTRPSAAVSTFTAACGKIKALALQLNETAGGYAPLFKEAALAARAASLTADAFAAALDGVAAEIKEAGAGLQLTAMAVYKSQARRIVACPVDAFADVLAKVGPDAGIKQLAEACPAVKTSGRKAGDKKGEGEGKGEGKGADAADVANAEGQRISELSLAATLAVLEQAAKRLAHFAKSEDAKAALGDLNDVLQDVAEELMRKAA